MDTIIKDIKEMERFKYLGLAVVCYFIDYIHNYKMPLLGIIGSLLVGWFLVSLLPKPRR